MEDHEKTKGEAEVSAEDLAKQSKLPIIFSDGVVNTTVWIESKDIHKLAKVIYDLCIDNKIDATIETSK